MRRAHRSPAAPRMPRIAAPAAWLLAAAMLLQSAFGLALVVQMADDALPAAVAEICSDLAGSPDSGDPSGLPAEQQHRHDQCVICQGGLGPLLLSANFPSASIGDADAPPEAPLPEMPPSRHVPPGYAPRAPPRAA
jgi:Protein of unknown function (DUF2946)